MDGWKSQQSTAIKVMNGFDLMARIGRVREGKMSDVLTVGGNQGTRPDVWKSESSGFHDCVQVVTSPKQTEIDFGEQVRFVQRMHIVKTMIQKQIPVEVTKPSRQWGTLTTYTQDRYDKAH